MGYFYGFEHENPSEQVHNVWSNEVICKKHFFDLLKKYDFSCLWLNIYLKKKNL